MPAPASPLPFLDDGLPSWGHVALGAGMRLLPAEAAAAVAFFFLLYQVGEPEPLANKLGDFGEVAAGYLGAAALGARPGRLR